jgi:hypothetical protein
MAGSNPERAGRDLSLELTSATGQTFAVAFRNAGRDLYAVAVPAGTYRITHLVFAPRGLGPQKQIVRNPLPLSQPFSAPFIVTSGRATYIGDYVAAASVEREFYGVATKTTMRWKLYEARFAYDQSARDFRTLYPAWQAVEVDPAWRRP